MHFCLYDWIYTFHVTSLFGLKQFLIVSLNCSLLIRCEICKDHRRWLNRNDCTNVWTITKAITNDHNTRKYRIVSQMIVREKDICIKINEGRRNESFFNSVFTTITDPVESIDTFLRSRSTHPTRFKTEQAEEEQTVVIPIYFFLLEQSLVVSHDPRIVWFSRFRRNDTQVPTTLPFPSNRNENEVQRLVYIPPSLVASTRPDFIRRTIVSDGSRLHISRDWLLVIQFDLEHFRPANLGEHGYPHGRRANVSSSRSLIPFVRTLSFLSFSFVSFFFWLYNGARSCADIRVVSVVHQKLFAVREARESSVVRPGVPDWSDHVRGRRVIWTSLLHVVHQRAVLAFIRVEARLLTTCHTAPVAWVHLLKMIQGLA